MPFRFTRTYFRSLCLIACAAALFWASGVRAENEGQDDLDKASEKKLSAESLDDLAQVVELCETALNKGLDVNNTAFANNLLTGTLMQRANVLARTIVQRVPPGWQQLRIMALADLDKALKIDANLAQAQLLIARLQSLPGGDRAAALKAAQRAIDVAKDNVESRVEALLLLAGLTEEREKKLDFYNQAIHIAPNNEQALRDRGLFLLVTGKVEEALVDVTMAAKADPENADLQELRGLALLLLKRNDEAIKAFSEAVKLAPDSPLPYLHRARVYAQDKKTKEAFDDIEQALKLDPDNINALLLRARVHQLAGDGKAARADVDAALRLVSRKNPANLAEALGLGASISAAAGDFRQAIADLETLLKIAPKNPQLLTQLGILYVANKQPRKAIEKYSAALAEDSQHFSAVRGRADAYLQIGKHAEAVTDYEAALKLKSQDAGVLNNLAWVLATSPEDSVRNAKRSIELGTEAAKVTDHKQAHILSTLAAGYAESGDFDKAREWSQKAVDLGSEDPETAAQLKKELASYDEKKAWREKQVVEENDAAIKPPEAGPPTTKLPPPPPAGDEPKPEDSSAAKETSAKKD